MSPKIVGTYEGITEKPSLRSLFWERTSIGGIDECWLWQGSRNHRWRYGRLHTNGKEIGAHRIAYELLIAPIPIGMQVLHHCDNPPCVNPRHLFLGTQGDNMRDRTQKGRTPRGERNGRARLTEVEVGEIRQKIAHGANLSALGREYNVSNVAIGHIKRKRNWRGIGNE